jgi:hypothetical protein
MFATQAIFYIARYVSCQQHSSRYIASQIEQQQNGGMSHLQAEVLGQQVLRQ